MGLQPRWVPLGGVSATAAAAASCAQLFGKLDDSRMLIKQGQGSGAKLVQSLNLLTAVPSTFPVLLFAFLTFSVSGSTFEDPEAVL
jgi:hypothetical protein